MLATAEVPFAITKREEAVATVGERDVRLDLFRGLCLVIIFIAHTWENPWADWIPARFGFSDAADIFVFCSGVASAIAFGGTYHKRGFIAGTARIVYRCWQVYWCHIGLVVAAAATALVTDRWLGVDTSYVKGVGLSFLFDYHAADALLGLATLRWVPAYFDILPMYLVVLALVPVVVALARMSTAIAMAFVAALWLGATVGVLQLPAEPWSNRVWFFNPFAWQLLFFIGFGLRSGWLPLPPPDARLIKLAVTIVVAAVPVAWRPLLDGLPVLREVREAIEPLILKTDIGLLRLVHFLSLAYLAWVAAGNGGKRLDSAPVRLLCELGRQSLAVFMVGLILSFVASTALNVSGRNPLTVAIVNLLGIASLLVVARTTAYFKSMSAPRRAKAHSAH